MLIRLTPDAVLHLLHANRRAHDRAPQLIVPVAPETDGLMEALRAVARETGYCEATDRIDPSVKSRRAVCWNVTPFGALRWGDLTDTSVQFIEPPGRGAR